MSVRRSAAAVSRLLILVGLLVVAGCASGSFSRTDAIVSLQTTGVTEAEATCMADSLSALDQRDAANPRKYRGANEREALVAAARRCVTVDVLSKSVERTLRDAQSDDDDPEGTPMPQDVPTAFRTPGRLESSDDSNHAQARSRLLLAGRSEVNAQCVIDHLVDIDAEHLFADPLFGQGLDPLEADAFASCL